MPYTPAEKRKAYHFRRKYELCVRCCRKSKEFSRCRRCKADKQRSEAIHYNRRYSLAKALGICCQCMARKAKPGLTTCAKCKKREEGKLKGAWKWKR